MKLNKEIDAKGLINEQRGIKNEESSCVSGPSRCPHWSMLVTLTLPITRWNFKKGTSECDKVHALWNQTETSLLESWRQPNGTNRNSITPRCRLEGNYIFKDATSVSFLFVSATLPIFISEVNRVTLILLLPQGVDHWRIDQTLSKEKV